MADLRKQLAELYTMERLAAGATCVHALHPVAKLAATAVYLLCVLSLDRYAVLSLLPFALYPLLLAVLAKVPFYMLVKRLLVALPFCLLAGVSNLFFDTAVWYMAGAFPVTYGMVSFFALLFRALLCVAAVLVLIAATPLAEIAAALRLLGVPAVFIALLEMTYRYGGVLVTEVSAMYTAYRLRGGDGGGVNINYMGAFIGQLLLRSFDRAERVYQAMRCRGYGDAYRGYSIRRLTGYDYCFLALVFGSCLMFRLMDWPILLRRLLSC